MRIERSSSQRTRDAQQVRARLQSLLHGGWVPDPESEAESPERLRWDPGRRGAVVLVAVAVLAAVLTGLWLWHSRPVAQAVSAPLPSVAQTVAPTVAAPVVSSPTPSQIAVAVAGKVRHPGVVRLPAGSRVVDAVSAAGGVARGAHLGLLNLAKVLADGEQVVVGVPSAPVAGGPAGSAAPSGPVNLNMATLEQLDGLPGIGPSTAQKILDWRTSNGPFRSVDQLQDVSGIGPAKFAALQAEVTV